MYVSWTRGHRNTQWVLAASVWERWGLGGWCARPIVDCRLTTVTTRTEKWSCTPQPVAHNMRRSGIRAPPTPNAHPMPSRAHLHGRVQQYPRKPENTALSLACGADWWPLCRGLWWVLCGNSAAAGWRCGPQSQGQQLGLISGGCCPSRQPNRCGCRAFGGCRPVHGLIGCVHPPPSPLPLTHTPTHPSSAVCTPLQATI
jgi:hypothetical protein